MISQRRTGLGHLHQAEHALVHARPAAGRDDDERQVLLRRPLN